MAGFTAASCGGLDAETSELRVVECQDRGEGKDKEEQRWDLEQGDDADEE